MSTREQPSDTTQKARPWWMTVMAVGCFLTAGVTLAGDLFVEAARNTEVWFGVEVYGWAAILTAPLHYIFFSVCGWAFWTERRWVIHVAAGYAFYAGLSHLVWSEVSENGRGWQIGVLQMIAISSVGVMLERAGRSLSNES